MKMVAIVCMNWDVQSVKDGLGICQVPILWLVGENGKCRKFENFVAVKRATEIVFAFSKDIRFSSSYLAHMLGVLMEKLPDTPCFALALKDADLAVENRMNPVKGYPRISFEELQKLLNESNGETSG